jgi:hypothetical protein
VKSIYGRALFAIAALCATPAFAQEGDPKAGLEGKEWHPYVFASDASTLGPAHAAIESGVGYNGVVQPQGLRTADGRRFDTWITGAVGLTDRLELAGSIVLAEAPGQNFGFGEGRVELRARVLDFHKRFPLAITLGAGYQADSKFESAFEGMIATTFEYGRFAATFNLRGIHYFANGRDPLDLYITAGASIRTTRWLRLGVEYVGEELEEKEVLTGTDGGNRNYVGPSAAVFLAQGKVRINATGGAVLSAIGNGPMARGSIAYLF